MGTGVARLVESFWQPTAASFHRRGVTIVELLVCVAIVAVLVMLFLPLRRNVGEVARRSQCKNNLKQIGLALHNYDAEYGSLPPAYTIAADGRRLHSWRTLLLPFLEEQDVYDRIDLSKPWDDPANEDAASRVVHVYSCPSADVPQTHTLYQAVVSPSSWIRADASLSLTDLSGSGETVLITEVDLSRAAHWMQPVDTDEAFWTQFDKSAETAHEGGLQAVFADGTARFIAPHDEANERERFLLRPTEPVVAPVAE